RRMKPRTWVNDAYQNSLELKWYTMRGFWNLLKRIVQMAREEWLIALTLEKMEFGAEMGDELVIAVEELGFKENNFEFLGRIPDSHTITMKDLARFAISCSAEHFGLNTWEKTLEHIDLK